MFIKGEERRLLPFLNFETMEVRELSIDKGQYLKEILPEIPTNTILDKTICGCGATTLELNTPRHSIIIEPNLPVIAGKKAKHDYMLGVTEKVKKHAIIKYLNNNHDDGYYKIMTTPESYPKVEAAIRSVGMNLHEDFFMLFDECERTTQDIDYRKYIILPIDDFFLCKGKAMVSATPSEFLDPRFEEQGFCRIKVRPTYDYRQHLSLRVTNNVFHELNDVLSKEEFEDKIFCFFLNSTDKTMEIIEELDIEDKTNIYCSAKSVKKLKERNYENSYSNLNEPEQPIALNKYNFFTSRFYSAVDIELPFKPVVIMLTEQFGAKYSIIDPQTEAVQISGRFRNGIEKFIHITNYNTRRKVKNKTDIRTFLEECHEAYNKHLYTASLTTKTRGERSILNQAKEKVDYADFVLSNGKKNYFRWSNFFRDIEVAEIYIKPIYIAKAYQNCEAFITEPYYSYYAVNDADRNVLVTNGKIRKNALNTMALNQIKKLLHSQRNMDKIYLKKLRKAFDIVFVGLKELGLEQMEQMSKEGRLVRAEIEHAVEKSNLLKRMTTPSVKKAVYKHFKENTQYTTAQVNDGLKKIYDHFDIPYDRKGCSGRINAYFNASPYKTKTIRGWKLGAKK